MFKHILVPLDGSSMAEVAIPSAIVLATQFDATVTLFHVIEKNAPPQIHGQRHLTDAHEANAYLEETAQEFFRKELAVDFHLHAIEAEDVAESIIAHATELSCDTIVMCSHGRGRALHLLLGSIAQRVIAKGSLPVVLIRPDKNGCAPVFSCKSLLVPLDNDPDHAQALFFARELARMCGAIIQLAMVIPSFRTLSGQRAATSRFLPGTMSELLELSVQDAHDYLQNQLMALTAEGFQAGSHVLRGDPATVIDSAASQLHADLIVMATHGKLGMEAFWSGSVANKVSSLIKVPLLLIRVEEI
jgi:nucleotide-binding universal stress UspA family protein